MWLLGRGEALRQKYFGFYPHIRAAMRKPLQWLFDIFFTVLTQWLWCVTQRFRTLRLDCLGKSCSITNYQLPITNYHPKSKIVQSTRENIISASAAN